MVQGVTGRVRNKARPYFWGSGIPHGRYAVGLCKWQPSEVGRVRVISVTQSVLGVTGSPPPQ